MTLFLNSLTKSRLNLNIRLITACRCFHVSSANQLYSSSALGIDGYLQSRKKVKEQFAVLSDKFRAKMNTFVSDQKNLIFTEDLKNMTHLAEPSDLELVTNMIKKFNSQNSEYRFGSFVFGPVVMRMFYFLDAPDYALKCFEDPQNSGFFDQLITYQILLDLLYNHEMYDEMYRVFEKIKEKQLNMSKYPKYPVVLIFAACYKQNTPVSFEYASKLWSDMSAVGNVPLRRAATFFGALALKQGAPHVALESITAQKSHYVTIRNIKVIALAELGRVDDAFPILRKVLDTDAPGQENKHTFFEDTILILKKAVEQKNDKDLAQEFDSIEKALRNRQLIDSQNMDNLLNAEITIVPKTHNTPSFPRKMPFGMRQKGNLQQR